VSYSSRQESSVVHKFQSLSSLRYLLQTCVGMALKCDVAECRNPVLQIWFYVWVGFTARVKDIIETLMASVVRNLLKNFGICELLCSQVLMARLVSLPVLPVFCQKPQVSRHSLSLRYRLLLQQHLQASKGFRYWRDRMGSCKCEAWCQVW
jgi:hypothetical protein